MPAEPTAISLFCPCGRQFFPMGAAPGQLTKCPNCGAWLRVPAAEPPAGDAVSQLLARSRRQRRDEARLASCLLYPLRDGPGVALLIFMPPFVWLMSVPAFDLIRFAWPNGLRGNFNPFFLLIAPLAIPLGVCFVLTLGYTLLFLGGILVASAMGEDAHPSWPTWDIHAILEGLGRWTWSALVGAIVGAVPLIVYWINCGDFDWFDRIILVELGAVGAGYAQMALASALLHDTLLASNPWTVLLAIRTIGWDYVRPSLVAATALGLVGGSFYLALFHATRLDVAAVGLWASWVLAFYAAMVTLRLLGVVYHRQAEALGWFRTRPKWAIWGRQGNLYANS